MIRVFILWLSVTAIAFAQQAPSSEFPAEAKPLEEVALREKLTGKAFSLPGIDGKPIRIEYRNDGWAFLNATGPGGAFNTSGKWRVEGSTLFIDWNRIPKGGGEIREIDGVLYVKRISDGQVVELKPK